MIVQIETAAGLDAVESIAKVPGVDILMMGPADLSLQLGVPGLFEHALLRDAAPNCVGCQGKPHRLGPSRR
ncbi:MAG: aldolase/citrate lyase family protein [Pirellulaceae bacterium]